MTKLGGHASLSSLILCLRRKVLHVARTLGKSAEEIGEAPFALRCLRGQPWET